MSRALAVTVVMASALAIAPMAHSDCRKSPCIPGEVVDFNGCCVRSLPKNRRKKRPARSEPLSKDALLRTFPRGSVLVAEVNLKSVRNERWFKAGLTRLRKDKDFDRALGTLQTEAGVNPHRDIDQVAIGLTEFDDDELYISVRGTFEQARVVNWLESLSRSKRVNQTYRSLQYVVLDEAAVIFASAGHVVVCKSENAKQAINALLLPNRSAAAGGGLKSALVSAGKDKTMRFATLVPAKERARAKRRRNHDESKLLLDMRWIAFSADITADGAVFAGVVANISPTAARRLADFLRQVAQDMRAEPDVRKLNMTPLFDNASFRVNGRETVGSSKVSAAELHSLLRALESMLR